MLVVVAALSIALLSPATSFLFAQGTASRGGRQTIGTDICQFLFKAVGSGAISRTVCSKLSDTVSVKDFGACGDGVCDDTAAIQAAITATTVSGQRLYFPAGTYL